MMDVHASDYEKYVSFDRASINPARMIGLVRSRRSAMCCRQNN